MFPKLNYFKATMILALMFFAYCLYLAVWPFKTIEFYNSPFPVNNENKEVCMGDIVKFQADYFRYEDHPVTIIRHIYQKPEDSPTGKERDFTYPTIESKFPKGAHDVEISRDVISIAAPDGKVVLKMSVTFPVNPLQSQEFYVETEPFTIKNCEEEEEPVNTPTTPTVKTETPTTSKSEGRPTEVKVESKSESKSETKEEKKENTEEEGKGITLNPPVLGPIEVKLR